MHAPEERERPLVSIYGRMSEAIRTLLIGERRKAGLNQVQFARAVKLSQPTISKIEKGGRYIKAAELVVFARALGADPLAVLGKAMALADAGASVQRPQARKVKRRATKPR
jgi:transcriptional regulator with XRE-family HTH domain